MNGIITATDANYFPGCHLLLSSVATQVPVCVVDLGLTLPQRRLCQRLGYICDPDLVMPEQVPGWQTWNKPFFIAQSPFRYSLWLDADCLVVGDLAPLFAAIRQEPLLVRHWECPFYAFSNYAELYRRFPVRRRLTPEQIPNAGVIGLALPRDQELLRTWQFLVQQAATEPTVRGWICWYDEGALHWSLEALQLTHLPRAQPFWNRYCSSNWPSDLRELSYDERDVVLHFAGNPKPWSAWHSGLSLPIRS